MSATGIEPLIGRQPELAQVEALLASMADEPAPGAWPQARVLLVLGDAGVGKTTLAREALARARHAGLAGGEGHCLDLATGTAFGPVIEALRQVVVSRSAAGLPVPPAAQWLATDAMASGEALERLLAAAAALAVEQPMVLVIEDLHWSERSTRDFALALVRTCRTPMLLVVTARSDDLAAEHPGRPAISELALSPGAVRLVMDGLDAAGVAELARRQLGRALSDVELATVMSRSGGNPLFAEEIMKTPAEPVPASLNDLLLRHVTHLSAPAAALVRLAAVGGAVIDLDLTREASGLDSATFETLAHEALAASVFTRHGDQFLFRHALLRDAVAQGLLPSERMALHRAYVEVLRPRGEVGTAAARWRAQAALAVHAEAAGDLRTALAAHVKAGLAAKQHGAPEAADHFESALALWPQVPEAAELAGSTDAEVVTLAAESLIRFGRGPRSGTRSQTENQRVQRLLRDALSRLAHVSDPRAASRVLTTVAYDWGDDVVLVENWAAAHRAIALVSGAPCAEWAQALGAKSSLHYRGHEYTRALAAAEAAKEIARAAGARTAEYESEVAVARAQHELGRLPASRAALRAAVELAEQAKTPGDALEARRELAWEWICAGRLDEGCELAKQGETAARDQGLARVANYHGEQQLEVLIWRGQLAEAGRRLDGLAARTYVEHRRRWLEVDLLIAVGNLGSALTVEERTIEAEDGSHLSAAGDALRRIDLFEQLGNTARELAAASSLLDRPERESPVQAAIWARCAMQALCAADKTGHPVPEVLAEAAASAMATAESGLSPDWAESIYGVHLAMAQAYAQRLDRRPAIDEWARAAVAAEHFGAYLALRPQLENAREQLIHGQRDAGKESLIALWRSAQSMGAAWFAKQAVSEARRHRVPLPASASSAASRQDRLTPREHDVLALLAQGATNRAIARSLYITDKTAALHVSNILAKLGVANRGEAAALARRTNDA